MSEPVFITLGSNIEPERHLPQAVALLRQNYRLAMRGVSRVYAFPPVDAVGEVDATQPAFLNAAVLVETGYYGPLRLKYEVLRFIETCLGRVRTADKFAPRTIDLDIALFGSRVQSGLLTLPDPDIPRRAHVILPLADLAPDFAHPVTGQTLGALAASYAGVAASALREELVLG